MTDDRRQLPSPETLMRKILVKGKRLSAEADAADADGDDDDEDEEDKDAAATAAAAAAAGGAASGSAAAPATLSKKKSKKEKSHHGHVEKSLSDITYLGTGKVKEFSKAASAAIAADMMCSYSEPTTIKNCKSIQKVKGWIYHNRDHLRFDAADDDEHLHLIMHIVFVIIITYFILLIDIILITKFITMQPIFMITIIIFITIL